MTYRLFEGKHHASIYQRYRFVPPEEIRDIILHYLERKNSRLLAPHFQEVVGIDISEKGTAEELPFPDGSVDLLTASSAAHWFDQQSFLLEAGRVLKPCGCLALLDFADNFRLHYGSCGDRLTDIYDEFKKVLLPYTSTQVAVPNTKLQDLYAAIPFPDKERIECIPLKQQISVRNIVGFIESFSMYQAFQRAEPDAATALLQRTHDRFLKEMGVTSPDTLIDVTLEYFCVLASKPE
ncbi:unnamed protein product [Coregonus sp. 'balchen']|nr:unnamed protein product [Coregonus sp. 'balchen']